MKLLFLAPILALTLIRAPVPAPPGGGADVTENFEGTGYENTWVEPNGSPNEDQSTAGLSLEGSQCLYITAESGAEESYVSFSATDTAYAYFLMRIENQPSGAGRTQFKFSNGTNDAFMAFQIGPTYMVIYSDGESQSDSGASFFSADTTYHFWIEYEKGTGANGQFRVYFSTDGTKPASPDAEITNSSDTWQPTRIYFGNDWSGSAGDIYYDKLRISRTAAFGSNPL